ncbi:MAG: hypothetical protein ACR2QT_11600 [Woeseiaceae bacterium]
MSVRQLVIGSLLATFSLMVAADEELPEIEFIEYLGLWEESDEDWTMFSDPIEARNKEDERSDPAPEGKESTETNDES